MKSTCKIFKTLLGSSLAITAFSAQAQKTRNNSHVTVNNTSNKYTFIASYNVNQQDQVIRYLNNYLRPEARLEPNKPASTKLALTDGSSLAVKITPGNLRITWDKNNSSSNAVAQVRKLEEDITRIIKPITE